MYRRPKFLEKLLDVRQTMATEADYDVIAFAQMTRTGDRQTRARKQPVTRVITGDGDNARRASYAKTKKRAAVKK